MPDLPAVQWCLAVAAGLLVGCAPQRPALFDAEALSAARRVVVLPLADGPGPSGKGAGAVHIIYGSSGGLSAEDAQFIHQLTL